MGWYVAHAIMFVQFKDGIQDHYPVWENMYLIKAGSHAEAQATATEVAKMGEGDSYGTFTWEDRPASWVFAGIRKTVECEDSESIPQSGTEVTYNQLIIRDKAAFDLFLKSKPVDVTLDDLFREDMED